jgi:uncharacterized protein YecT (DUF1311 family)
LKGRGFSDAMKAARTARALAPEGCFKGVCLALRCKTRVASKALFPHFSWLFTVIVLISSIPCRSQDSAQFRACMQKEMSQAGMDYCAGKEAERADAELNDVYQKLMSKAAHVPGATEKVRAFEGAWMKYRDTYLEAMYPAEDKQLAYGTVYPMDVALVRAGLTRGQTKKLEKLIKQYDDGGQ